MDVSGEEGPWESLEVEGRVLFGKNGVYLFQIWNRKAAVTMREGCGKEIGEATTDNKKRHRRRRKRCIESNDKTFGGG